jgi:hypothetical protein
LPPDIGSSASRPVCGVVLRAERSSGAASCPAPCWLYSARAWLPRKRKRCLRIGLEFNGMRRRRKTLRGLERRRTGFGTARSDPAMRPLTRHGTSPDRGLPQSTPAAP